MNTKHEPELAKGLRLKAKGSRVIVPDCPLASSSLSAFSQQLSASRVRSVFEDKKLN